jgi:hypothetical protein
MLSQRYTVDDILEKNLNDHFEQFPSIENREFWDDLAMKWKDPYCSLTDSLVGKPLNVMTATKFMEFARNGNRSNYQHLIFERRRDFCRLVITECLTNEGKYIDSIIDLIWGICEESSWNTPASNYGDCEYDPLPDVDNPFVMLYAAEAAASLAAAYHLLKSVLDKHSKNICKRIKSEINKRLFKPYMEKDTFWWMGLQGEELIYNGNHNPKYHNNIPTSWNEKRFVCNYNPWINSNLLFAVLTLEDDRNKKIKFIEKSMRSIDAYIDNFAKDGGCEEGPAYWCVSAPSMFEYLDRLSIATNGKIDVFLNY